MKKLYLLLTALLIFFRPEYGFSHNNRNVWTPAVVENIMEAERLADSTDAADIFLIPFYKEIDSVARINKLPPALLAAFVQEESNFNPFATRTEPSYLKKKAVIAAARKWSREHGGIPTYQTELFYRSTSMGLMQPMGEVAREQGFNKKYLSELITPFNSLSEGAKHLKTKLRRYGKDTLSAISAYNQGSNKKRRGVFLNARYVYRVTVAWHAYDLIFTESLSINQSNPINEYKRNHSDNTNTSGKNQPHFHSNSLLGFSPGWNAPSGMQLQIRQTGSNFFSYPNYGAARVAPGGLGKSGSDRSEENSIVKGKSEQKNQKATVLFFVLGFISFFGLSWILFKERSYTNISGHGIDLPQSLDRRTVILLKGELAKTKRNREIYGKGFTG
jgi:soluble lytic murein transglycosylase-like protein